MDVLQIRCSYSFPFFKKKIIIFFNYFNLSYKYVELCYNFRHYCIIYEMDGNK